MFEFQSTTTNGAGAGNLKDDDADKGVGGDTTANDNVGGNLNSPYFGSRPVSRVYVSPAVRNRAAISGEQSGASAPWLSCRKPPTE